MPWQCDSLASHLLHHLAMNRSSMAREVEDVVRTNGAVPAVIGILEGSIHVGLHNEELEFLAKSNKAVKVSRRDLPYVLSQVLHIPACAGPPMLCDAAPYLGAGAVLGYDWLFHDRAYPVALLWQQL